MQSPLQWIAIVIVLNIQYDCNNNHNTNWLWEDPNIILTSDSCGYTHALGDKELNGNI